MYMGNASLRKAGEEIEYTPEMLQEYVRCKEDIIYFAEKYFYIITIDEGKILINLYNFQKKILKACIDPPDHRNYLITMMPRQQGKTTTFSIYFLWYILFHRDKTVALLANKQSTAIEILDRVKTAYQNLPLWLQQGIADAGWNQKSISLENGSRIIAESTSSDAISGWTISLLYLDEFAKVPRHVAEDFITSTYPVISSGQTSKIMIVSTPVGLNHFYEFWIKAVRGQNNFYPIKVGWWEKPGRDKEWKKKTEADIGKLRFAQEYGCKFLGSSSTLIDSDILEQIELKDPIDTKWTGLFNIYEEPKSGAVYVLGVDTGKGVGRDYSVIQVLKIVSSTEIYQVAVYRNNQISPQDFAQVCISVSEFYNNAQMMVENNDIGQTVCDTIWYEYECDRLLNFDTDVNKIRKNLELGIRSTRKTKLQANVLLKNYMEKEWLSICDQRTVYELSRYEEVRPNVFNAGRDDHDDCVTSLLWALFYVNTPYYEGFDMGNKTIDTKYRIDNDEEDDSIYDEPPPVVFDGEEYYY